MEKPSLASFVLAAAFAHACALVGAPAHAQTPLDAALAPRVQALADEAARLALPRDWRAEVKLGRLDARLKLAPCADMRPHLPAGARLWGHAHIGIRCHDAAVRWNVYLPVEVKVFGPGLVAAAALPAGHTLAATDLQRAEVQHSASAAAPITEHKAPELIGRTLVRALAAGEPLRETDLKTRQFFAAGDTVRVIAVGNGWRIAGEGQALAPGLEGKPVRVRTESGRVVAGIASAEREVEIGL